MSSSKNLKPSNSPYFPNVMIRSQFLTSPVHPPKDTDLTGKVAIVTGSNVGLGLECVRQLLSYKLSRVVMAVRSTQKGEEAASGLRTQYPKAEIIVMELDMTSYESIQAFVKRIENELSRLDIAILNAGIGFRPFTIVSSTGHEETVQVNYLSTMLLAVLLLPALKNKSPAGTPGRLTIVSTTLTVSAEFPNRDQIPLLPSFNNETYYNPKHTYATSKLLGHMFVWKLSDTVSPDDVIINLAEPGFIRGTELHRGTGFAENLFLGFLKRITGRTLQTGASAYLDAALVKGKESHGSFLADWKVFPYPSLLYTPEGKQIMDRLWKETLEELSFAGIPGILKS